jgi:hypothetical protein
MRKNNYVNFRCQRQSPVPEIVHAVGGNGDWTVGHLPLRML